MPAARARAPAAPGARPGAGSELLEVLGAFSGHFCSRFPDPRPVPTRRPSQHAERSSGIKASDGADPQRPQRSIAMDDREGFAGPEGESGASGDGL